MVNRKREHLKGKKEEDLKGNIAEGKREEALKHLKRKREDQKPYNVAEVVKRRKEEKERAEKMNQKRDKEEDEPPTEEEEDEDEGEPRSRSLSDFIQSRGRFLWMRKRVHISFPNETVKASYRCLDPCFRQWLRTVGESMINRFLTGGSLKMPFSSKRIAIVDGHVRLPNPSRTQPKNKMAMVSIIEQHKSLCLEFVNVNKSAASADMNHLVQCLDYIISKIQEPVDHILLFKGLLCHFTYGCSYGKLTFVEHSMRFLKKTTNGLQGYKSYRQKIKYDIYATIRGNPVFVQVYFYPLGKPPKDAAIESWTKYENTCVGVLNFMINFIKHADEECDKLGLMHFTDEEKEAMLEHYFPGEMHKLFFYLWICSLNMDWTQQLRLCSC